VGGNLEPPPKSQPMRAREFFLPGKLFVLAVFVFVPMKTNLDRLN
jgi:hypothetical protein